MEGLAGVVVALADFQGWNSKSHQETKVRFPGYMV